MKAEFTAIIEPAPEGGFWAICPEVPGANGQGETLEEAKNNLREAIELILAVKDIEKLIVTRANKNHQRY
jgi:predicted RNase H-like HicB family nuclease